MARAKKINTEQLIALIDQYALNHPQERITIPALSGYICKNGFDVAPYLIRRDKIAREHINKINEQDSSNMQRSVVTYHQLDIDNFISTNSNIDKMKAALAQRDAYYASIARSAAIAFKENNDLKNSNRCFRNTIDKLRSDLENEKQKADRKVKKARNEVILSLKRILDDYVYPEVANLLLEKEGLLETTHEIVDKEKLLTKTVNPNTDISQVTFRSIEKMMKEFDE